MTTDDTTQQLPPESPQPRRLLRARSGPRDRGRLRRPRPLLQRGPAVLPDRCRWCWRFVGRAGLLAYLAALLLVPAEGKAGPVTPGAQGRNRVLVIVAVVVWP